MIAFGPMWAGLAWSGCAKEVEDAAPVVERAVVSVQVLPGDSQVLTHQGGGEGIQLTAVVSYDDLEVVQMTEGVEWSSSNETAGTVSETGWFEPSTTNGGVTWVKARLDGIEGQITVTVRYQEERVEGAANPSLVDGLSTYTPASFWLYPEDGVNLPRNTPSIQFQWDDPSAGLGGEGGDTGGGVLESPKTWRLRFSSELTDVVVYTDALTWTADAETWQAIASTNAGGSVTLELAGGDGSTGWQAEPLDIQVNRFDADGSIVYWSTSAQGFMEVPYAEQAQPYLTAGETGHCMGCHAISRNGDIAFTYDGGNGELGVMNLEDGTTPVPYGTGLVGNFKAWSPDGSRLLTTMNGLVTLYDTVSWQNLGSIALTESATHVDWSPDGSLVALTVSSELSEDWHFAGGSIAVVEAFGDDSFGAATVLYTPPEGMVAYYPAFSPDGDWIAFNISTGDAYDDVDAELWVIPSTGGTPLRLDSANAAASQTNSWPRWGPLPDDDILWLAFSSKRRYGTLTSGNPQIWVTAFNPALAEVGLDPSWPAFWLPNQDVAEGNHIPVWTE